ncbi:MAG: hypothetical protein JST50_09090 [Bacteroidetes bacterium]|jgi:hypothetical protein|nr:hypothetical protein [Bacteroidota bacterium]
MEFDIYTSWNPIEISSSSIDMRSLTHEMGVLVLLFEEWTVGKPFKIVFDSYFSYRITVESGRIKSLNNPTLQVFGQTKKSEYLDWFKDESSGIYDDQEMTHYSILCQDGIIDVITSCIPKTGRII